MSYLVFLVSLEQSLGAGHVLGELVGRDDGLHVVDPRDQVAEVGQEPVQVVRLVQLLATFLSLRSTRRHGSATIPRRLQLQFSLREFASEY
jgi:hypothetical protein